MDAKLFIDLLRLSMAITGSIRTFLETASPEQIKAFVDGVHAQGGTITLDTVDNVVGDLNDTIARVKAKAAAAGG